MLQEMTLKQFNQWWASAIVEGWANGWEQPGTVAAEVHNAGRLIVAALTDGKLNERDIRLPDDYSVFSEADKRGLLTANESEAKAAARYGK